VPYRSVFFLLLVLAISGCAPSQPVKNAWKGTRNVWYSYVNVPASINYKDKASMQEYETYFSKAMMGIDVQLLALERAMQNADKPPTQEWLNAFFTQFPWVDGITGLNNEGALVGHAGRAEKTLDYSALLESDPKQNLHALRGHVQNADGAPEVLLAVPLHDGPNFLGLVVAYFEMRSLMRYSDTPESLIITSPDGLLWSGRSAGSLPDADWKTILLNGASGVIADDSGAYQWVGRYLGNYPLVFAMQKTASGSVPEGAASKVAPLETPVPESSPTPPAAFEKEPVFDPGDLDLTVPPVPKL
jgi:hypothetical protein